jgi:hypothetical protein
MKRTWTIIGVGDVPGSSKWYQALLGQPAILPAHDYFGQILGLGPTFRFDDHPPALRGTARVASIRELDHAAVSNQPGWFSICQN